MTPTPSPSDLAPNSPVGVIGSDPLFALRGMSGHHSARADKDEWLTPPELLRALGDFDLDPCSPVNRPWPTAARHLTWQDNGLLAEWKGRVWCNHCNSFRGCTTDLRGITSGDETLFDVRDGKASGLGSLPAAQRNGGRTKIELPGLRASEGKKASDTKTRGSSGANQDSGRKEATPEKHQGEEMEAASIFHGQPQKKAASFATTVELDGKGLAEVQGGMEGQMRVLRSERGIDSRPLHSSDGGTLPRNNPKQHGSSLPEVQHQQAASTGGCLVERQTEACPNCGLPAFVVVKKPRVFCNPPYGREAGRWLARCAEHGNATALIFARTETSDWVEHVWKKADAILFLFGRLHFYHVDGRRAAMNSGAPSALISYDAANTRLLETSLLPGRLVRLANTPG